MLTCQVILLNLNPSLEDESSLDVDTVDTATLDDLTDAQRQVIGLLLCGKNQRKAARATMSDVQGHAGSPCRCSRGNHLLEAQATCKRLFEKGRLITEPML